MSMKETPVSGLNSTTVRGDYSACSPGKESIGWNNQNILLVLKWKEKTRF